MLSDEEEALLRPALSYLADNFPDFAIAVLSNDEKLLHYDYSNWRIGRMLFRDSLEDMGNELEMSEEMAMWDDWDDDEDYE
jgi:hypothetical protein